MIKALINHYIKKQFSKRKLPMDMLDAMCAGLKHRNREDIESGFVVTISLSNISDAGLETHIESFDLISYDDR